MNNFNNLAPSQCPVSALSDTFKLSNEQLEAVFKSARNNSPVTYLEDIGFWAITKYDDIKKILGDKENFSSEITLQPLEPFAPEVMAVLEERNFSPRPTLSNNEGDNHAKIRPIVQSFFAPKNSEKIEPFIRDLVGKTIDKFANEKHIDIVKEMFYELPALVLFKVLGVPDSDVEKIKMWADSRLVLSFGKPSIDEQIIAANHLVDYWDYCLDLVQQRIKQPQDDLPSAMLEARHNDDSVIEIEDINNVVFGLLLAGHETTTNLSANALLTLLQNAESWQNIVDDPTKIPNAIEECIRYRPSVVAWRRLVKNDVTIAGVDIAAGQKVLCYLPSANREEARFENGEQLDICRKNARQHISFGFGRHFCLGAPLARLELKVILEELSKRLPKLKLVEDQSLTPVEAVQFRGPKELWVEWD